MYTKLCLPGDNSPPASYYGLPKIHKPDVLLRPIISACGTSIYKLSKFSTIVLQRYTGKNFSFVKDMRGLADSLKGKSIKPDETLVFFDVCVLLTSIPVPVDLELLNRKLTDHMSQGLKDFLEYSHSIPKDKIITFLELVLNNCVVSFQHKFYKQLQGAAMGTPVSPVISNIYIDYFEELALGPQCPIPTPWWKRYVDDVICITKKDPSGHPIQPQKSNRCPHQVHYVVSWQWRKNSFLGLFLSASLTSAILSTPQCIENLHILIDIWTQIPNILYLQKMSYKHSSIGLKWYGCTSELLAKEMNYLNKVLCRNSYPDWFLKKKQ